MTRGSTELRGNPRQCVADHDEDCARHPGHLRAVGFSRELRTHRIVRQCLPEIREQMEIGLDPDRRSRAMVCCGGSSSKVPIQCVVKGERVRQPGWSICALASSVHHFRIEKIAENAVITGKGHTRVSVQNLAARVCMRSPAVRTADASRMESNAVPRLDSRTNIRRKTAFASRILPCSGEKESRIVHSMTRRAA